jgi:mitochondrial fission protein ELM1
VIKPIFSDRRQAFETQFSGMANIPFSYNDFERTRIQLIEEIQSKLTNDDRSFLLSFKNGVPDWGKLPIKKVNELPAVQWKLYNIERLKQRNPEKHIEMLKNLENNLSR